MESGDDGTWDRRRFAEAHILFPERSGDYDYIAALMMPEGPNAGRDAEAARR
ncbi:MAG: hypothetical protein QME60_08310 [Verrucomicrobiota bacterium]|nr:hypothetical protein [Verrucomicrobiota bacterium]